MDFKLYPATTAGFRHSPGNGFITYKNFSSGRKIKIWKDANRNGAAGNDILNGGDGFDIISETGGTDKIVFGSGITQNDLSFEQIGNDLKISVNGNEIKGLQINNHFSSSANQVESIEFADGATLDLTNADQLIQAMNSFGTGTSSTTDALSDPTENVSDMYNLAAASDLIKKAV